MAVRGAQWPASTTLPGVSVAVRMSLSIERKNIRAVVTEAVERDHSYGGKDGQYEGWSTDAGPRTGRTRSLMSASPAR